VDSHLQEQLLRMQIEDLEVRRVIAITTDNGQLAALCNDGTMWQLIGGRWEQLDPIPQPGA